MNADEIVRIDEAVKALHRLSKLLVTSDNIVCCEAAALIESLQAQLAKYDEVAAEYGIDGKTMLTLAKSQIKTAQDNIKLQEQLAASREKADFVRCKYCEYWQDNNGGYPHEECRWGHDETPDADDFCSCGKRLEVEP